MPRQLSYFSFGSSDEFSLKRQLGFCAELSNYLETSFNFYCFHFPDEIVEKDDRVTLVPIQETEHFFSHFQTKISTETIVFNHAFFHDFFYPVIYQEDAVFFYHKLDAEYVFLKDIGTASEVCQAHRKKEVDLMKACDWLYTSSEILLQYFKENEGYHQHKHSLIPGLKFLTGEFNVKVNVENPVTYLHIGPVSNRGIKYIKKIMSNDQNQMVLLSDDTRGIMKQGFAKNDRFSTWSFSEANWMKAMAQCDYVLLRPKPKLSSWIRLEAYFPDFLTNGLKLLLPKEYNADYLKLADGLITLEETTFDLPKTTWTEKEKISQQARDFFNLNEIQNSIKFRNAKNIHMGLVLKSNPNKA